MHSAQNIYQFDWMFPHASVYIVTLLRRWVMWESTSCGRLRSLSSWLISSSGTWRPTYTWMRREIKKIVRFFFPEIWHMHVHDGRSHKVIHCDVLPLYSGHWRAAGADGGGDHRLTLWPGQRLLPEGVWLLQQDHQRLRPYQVQTRLTVCFSWPFCPSCMF